MVAKSSGDAPGNLTKASYYGGSWHYDFTPPAQYGWICPRCGTVWSPSMIMCTCGKSNSVSSGSTDTLIIDEQQLDAMANDPEIAPAERDSIREVDAKQE